MVSVFADSEWMNMFNGKSTGQEGPKTTCTCPQFISVVSVDFIQLLAKFVGELKHGQLQGWTVVFCCRCLQNERRGKTPSSGSSRRVHGKTAVCLMALHCSESDRRTSDVTVVQQSLCRQTCMHAVVLWSLQTHWYIHRLTFTKSDVLYIPKRYHFVPLYCDVHQPVPIFLAEMLLSMFPLHNMLPYISVSYNVYRRCRLFGNEYVGDFFPFHFHLKSRYDAETKQFLLAYWSVFVFTS